jgi:uncharacterized protein (TIGR03643 family)
MLYLSYLALAIPPHFYLLFSRYEHCYITTLSAETRKSIIALAWNDRTPFDTIVAQFGISEKDVRRFMRRSMKTSSFKRWRERISSRVAKPEVPKPTA